MFLLCFGAKVWLVNFVKWLLGCCKWLLGCSCTVAIYLQTVFSAQTKEATPISIPLSGAEKLLCVCSVAKVL